MEPPKKPVSHRNFGMKFAPYMFALSKTMTSGEKNNKNVELFQNGGQITDFYSVASFRFWPKI